MRVLLLTQWYPPEPVSLMHDLAESLRALGHDVTVVTGFPNYPSGRVYPGYRVKCWLREHQAGVEVVRVALYPDHGRSGLKRAANYLSFALTAAFFAPFLAKRPDVIFVYHPPLTVGFPAVWLSWLWGVPFVYQVQDIWPETLRALGKVNNERLLSLVGRLARWIYSKASAVCVISEGFRQNLLGKMIPGDKIHVISNWVDTNVYYPEQLDTVVADYLGLSGRFNVMFAGNIGEAQHLETVLEAAARVRDLEAVQFVIVGDGVAEAHLRDLAREARLANVLFLGRFPTGSMPGLYATAEVLLVHLKADPLFDITIPHKILAYMASGKPVLAAVRGDAARLVSGSDAGLVCDPENPEALAATVRRFYELPSSDRGRMGQNGLAAIRAGFTRTHLVGRVEAVLKAAVASA